MADETLQFSLLESVSEAFRGEPLPLGGRGELSEQPLEIVACRPLGLFGLIAYMNSEVWYREGLPFECVPGCGRCCTGEPGYVWVTPEEIKALAVAGGMEVAQFEESFVRQVGKRKSLVEHANGDCVFFDSNTRHCLIYALRPRQCRTYPFWDSNLRTPEAWQQACEACPGCGQGPIIPLEEIQTRMRLIRI